MRKFHKFDMLKWEMGEDVESASSFPAADFIDNVTKLAESFGRGLEGKFDNTVRDGVSMALSFFARDPHYCGFAYTEMVTENNPDGIPSIGFYFGEDYEDRESFLEFLETCDSGNLQTLIEIIVNEKAKRSKENELRKLK